MWQTAVIVLVVVAVLIYVIRHYARVYRSEVPACSCCSECCSAQPPDGGDACEYHGGGNRSVPGEKPAVEREGRRWEARD